jgi:hypothetical protein
MAAHRVEGIQLFVQHLPVEEEQGRQRLVRRGGGHVAIHRQVRQEGLDLRCAHLVGMALAMKEDEPPDPVDISIFGADGIVFEADGIAHPIQELFGFHGKSPRQGIDTREGGG